MKLDPRHLEILSAIVEHGGLTEGAEALGKSQPSVSRSLSMLEERLGIELFEAGRRPLRPTDFCLALAAEGKCILRAGAQASQLVDQYRSGKSGAIRLAGTPIFMDGVVSDMIAAFQASAPDVRIDQSYGYYDEIVSGLQNGTLDMGIVPVRNAVVPEQLFALQILQGRNVIACRIGHPLSRADEITLDEISKYSWITPPSDSPLYHDIRGFLEGFGIQEFKVSFTGGSLTSVTRILSASESLTVLPYSVVHMLRRQNMLTALPIRIGDPNRNLCTLMRKETAGSPALKRFSEFLQAEFRALSGVLVQQESSVFSGRLAK